MASQFKRISSVAKPGRFRGMWEWLGEPLALDFANTLLRRGWSYEDQLREPGDLAEWARRQRGRVPVVAPDAVAGRLDEVRALRDDCFALLRATADGAPLPPDAARRVNDLVRRHPVVPALAAVPGEGESTVAGDPDPLDELLARAADATVRTIADPDSALGLCDAPSCGQFFLRARADQRWCGPACGNRARVARHAHPAAEH